MTIGVLIGCLSSIILVYFMWLFAGYRIKMQEIEREARAKSRITSNKDVCRYCGK